MRHITRTFLTGLATVLPVVATLYLVYWLASSAESILGQFFPCGSGCSTACR